jgi:hypothetical protein
MGSVQIAGGQCRPRLPAVVFKGCRRRGVRRCAIAPTEEDEDDRPPPLFLKEMNRYRGLLLVAAVGPIPGL